MYKKFSIKLLTILLAVQILNISLNISDSALGKNLPNHKYINEIETVVEFIVEIILEHEDAIAESQSPNGSDFEEEEEEGKIQQAFEFEYNYEPVYYVAGILYDKGVYHDPLQIKDPVSEVTTPPPQA